jgi:hypothetical protein
MPINLRDYIRTTFSVSVMSSGPMSKMRYGASMDVRELSRSVLYHPAPQLWLGTLRNFLMGIFFGTVLLTGYARYEAISWNSTAALFLVGVMLSLFLWGSFRVWSFTVFPMMEKKGQTLQALTRIPFWCMAGGIGYTFGLLIAKKINLLTLQDIPVKSLFYFGCKFGTGMELFFECARFIIMKRREVS